MASVGLVASATRTAKAAGLYHLIDSETSNAKSTPLEEELYQNIVDYLQSIPPHNAEVLGIGIDQEINSEPYHFTYVTTPTLLQLPCQGNISYVLIDVNNMDPVDVANKEALETAVGARYHNSTSGTVEERTAQLIDFFNTRVLAISTPVKPSSVGGIKSLFR